MRKILIFGFLTIVTLCGCKDQKREYIENVKPVMTGLEQIRIEMDSSVDALKNDGISIMEFETKIQELEGRLKKEKEKFTQWIAPMDLDDFQKNIQEAIAGEELAISAIKSYATRKNMFRLAEKQIAELKKEEQLLSISIEKGDKTERTRNRLSKISSEIANLKRQKDNLDSEMDAQMRFFSNSHEYFTKMLQAMKRRLK